MDGADTIAMLIVFGIMLLTAGCLGFAAGRIVGPLNDPRDLSDDDEERTPYDDFADEEIDEEELPALKVDPENPPTWKIYKGPGGPRCNCHDRPIQYGENILMWPDPENPGAYRLFHEDFVEGMKPHA